MKKILSIISLSVAVLLSASCEDFLTKVPETDLSPDTFFTTEAELEMWTNNLKVKLFTTSQDVYEAALKQGLGSDVEVVLLEN